MSALSDALAAMDKLHFDEEFQQFLGPANAWEAIDKSKLSALAWIEKAMPELESYRDKIQRERLSDSFSGSYRESVMQEERLDALLAEAKEDNGAKV